MKKHFEEFYKEYHLIEKDATIEIKDCNCDKVPMTVEATQKFVNFINVYPFAVMRYSPSVQGDIETSTTLAEDKIDKPNTCLCFDTYRSYT